MPRESCSMTTHAITPHTRIDNALIDNLAGQIGIYGLGIYVAIKRYLNTKTGDCFPSYKTIAKKLHIDRGTVIRYVKKMKELNIISPEWRFKEDGSHTSNQYNFDKGGCAKQLEVVAANNQPGCPEPPKQSSSPNKKIRTIAEVDLMPTEKQKTCPHPPEFIVILPDDITVCNHCYGLLDENFNLREERTTPEIVEAA
jgi:GntR family transcriptional regulator